MIDASSWLEAWQRYPMRQFPKLWEWLSEEIENGNMQTIKVMHKEVKHKIDEYAEWLDENNVAYPRVREDDVLARGIEIKNKAGITTDIKDNKKGIDDNDLELIAVASLSDKKVVTEEKVQKLGKGTKSNSRNYKIPLVCQLNNVDVTNFLEMMKASGKTFG